MSESTENGIEWARGWRFHKGKFYLPHESGWQHWHKNDLKQHLRVGAGLTPREAAAVLSYVEWNQPAVEPELLAKIAWDQFTRGQCTMIILGRAVFLDRHGNGVRNMSIERFARAYMKIFGDSDTQRPEGTQQ